MSFQDKLNKANPKDARDVLIPVMPKKSENEQKDNSVNMNNNTEHKNVSVNENTESKQETISMNSINNTEASSETVIHKNVTGEALLSKYLNKKKKLTVEDTHDRYTFLMRKDLKKRLNKLAKSEDRGFKTDVLNDGLEMILDKLEKMMK